MVINAPFGRYSFSLPKLLNGSNSSHESLSSDCVISVVVFGRDLVTMCIFRSCSDVSLWIPYLVLASYGESFHSRR